MKKILAALSITFLVVFVNAELVEAQPAEAQTTVTNLLTENLHNPLGLDAAQPRLSWQLQSPRRNTRQQAYEVVVRQGSKAVWQSGKVASDSSVHVTYKGAPLQPATAYTWQVRVYTGEGKPSPWSAAASFTTGLWQPADWKAQWIEPGYAEDSPYRASPLMRKPFTVKKKLRSALAIITARGMYEAQLNGQRVGDAYLSPGWTAYQKRIQYQCYDVTSLLQPGANAVGVTLGDGWYRGTIGFANNRNKYGSKAALLFQLMLTYTDGSTELVLSDGTWACSTGPIRFSEIYNGELYDARQEKAGWATAAYNAAGWVPVKPASYPFDNLVATQNEPVKKHEVFKPVKVFTTPAGEQVIDFGQNLVGWVKVTAQGNAGDTVTLRHAEVLDKKGNMYYANLRAARQTNHYILQGGPAQTFEPHFTFQGFRYIQVSGLRKPLQAQDFEAVALYSAMEPTGSLTTSRPLINQLQHNIQWGQRGNFVDVPTDCPQRDERLGWTGDAQAFSRTAAFNMNVNSFMAKWLQDVEADQVNGAVPFVVPNVLGPTSVNSAGWSDAATIIPWNMYLAYGDKQLLANQYNSMKAYVESMRKVAKDNLWNSGFHFGDWLFYRPEDDNDGRAAVTDKYLIAQCFYAHSTDLLVQAARVLGHTQDAEAYSKLLADIKAAFQREYLTPSGRLVSSTQTAYVLALQFDMLPENQRKQAAQRLADNVQSYGHLTTGFLGTPYLCHVLTRYGYTDAAYKLLLREKYPSWLYPVTMGATTIWERWDGMKPDSSFQTPGMNSFNHYAYGAIGDWMYRQMVGLDTYEDGVGYKHIRVKPLPGGGFTHAEATLKTYYGETKAGWKLEGNSLQLNVTVPPNTRATIYIPASAAEGITEGGLPLAQSDGLKVTGQEGGYVVVEAGSGSYSFRAPKGN
jgi:alpha-L-rhamnosidase